MSHYYEGKDYKRVETIILGFIRVALSSQGIGESSYGHHCFLSVFGIEVFMAQWKTGTPEEDRSDFYVHQEFYPVSDGDTSKDISMPVRKALINLGLYNPKY